MVQVTSVVATKGVAGQLTWFLFYFTMASTCHHDIRYVLITGVYLFFPSLSTIFLRPGPKVLLLSSNYQYNISLVHPRAVSALKPIINGVNFPLVQKKKRNKRIGLRRDPTSGSGFPLYSNGALRVSHSPTLRQQPQH